MTRFPFILSVFKPLATLASGLGRQKKLFILIYHRVLDKPDFMRPGEVDISVFNWQMELLANFFNVLPLTEAVDRLYGNTLPPRAVAITFDDGYADNLHNALPILQHYGLTATFFIASGFLDGGRMWNDTVIESIRGITQRSLDLTEIDLGACDISTEPKKAASAAAILSAIKHLHPRIREKKANLIGALSSEPLPADLMLTTQQLKTLAASGMDIGGHTENHPILTLLDGKAAKKEIFDNKCRLEKILNKEIRAFAYPNGKPGADYLPEHVDIVKDCGYRAAFSTQWGVGTHKTDLWQLPRFTPWDKSPEKFLLRMAHVFAKG